MSSTGDFEAEGGFVITGAANIEAVRLLAVRGALKLEVLGMRKHGRSAQTLANEAMGTNIRTKKATYVAFDTWLVENVPGAVSRPLPERM